MARSNFRGRAFLRCKMRACDHCYFSPHNCPVPHDRQDVKRCVPEYIQLQTMRFPTIIAEAGPEMGLLKTRKELPAKPLPICSDPCIRHVANYSLLGSVPRCWVQKDANIVYANSSQLYIPSSMESGHLTPDTVRIVSCC